MSSRRDALRVGGGAMLAFLAGCVAESPSNGDAPDAPSGTDSTAVRTTSETRTPTAEPAPEVDVRVRDVSVAPSLVAPNSLDSIATFGARDEQFVLAGVGTRGRLPFAREEFEVVVDEETYAPTPPGELTTYGALWKFGDAYEREKGGFLLFRLPKPFDADTVSFRWPTGEHRLRDEQIEKLRLPPTTFEVTAFDAPESVLDGERTTLTVTVENVGDADGTFVGALNRVGPLVAYAPVQTVSLDVSVGESATWTHSHTPSLNGADETGSMTFLMPWRDGEARSTTAVERRDVSE